MTIPDLEYAVTRPTGFLSRLQQMNGHGNRNLQAYGEHFIDFDDTFMPSIYGTQGSLRCLYVVPGGRFVVTSHLMRPDPTFVNSAYESHLNIWDVGWFGAPYAEPHPIPIVAFNHYTVGNLTPVHPTRDGQGLLLFARQDEDHVAAVSYWQRRQSFHIYEIYPQVETTLPPRQARVREVGNLMLEVEGQEKCCFSFQHLAMVFNEQTVMVWDFINDSAASWKVPDLYRRNNETAQTILLKGNHVIVILGNDLLIWTIPQLYPLARGTNAYQARPRPPIWSCSLDGLVNPATGKLFRSTVEKLDDWYTDSGQPHYFDVVMQTGSAPEDLPLFNQPTIYRYRLNVPDLLADDYGLALPAQAVLTRIATFYYPVEVRYDDFVPKFYRISRGEIVVSRIRHESALHIYGHSATSGVSGDNVALVTLDLPAVSPELLRIMDVNHVAVCPSSGKIFLFLQRTTQEIVIVDTVRHPRSRSSRFCDLTLRVYDPDRDPTRHRFGV